MKFTFSWLKEYLKTDKDINTILENLTNIGLEVEESLDQYSVYKDFKVAKIISTKKHPNADRLQLCLVDIGDDSCYFHYFVGGLQSVVVETGFEGC